MKFPFAPPATLFLLCALLSSPSSPTLGQDGRGRDSANGVIKSIRNAIRDRESFPAAGAPFDPNAFRAVLPGLRQDLTQLAAATQRTGTPGLKALGPQVVQLMERTKVAEAYLARESRPEAFAEHERLIDQQWRSLSSSLWSLRGADPQLPGLLERLDDQVNALGQALGNSSRPGPIAGTGGSSRPAFPGRDADALLDQLDREMQTLFDQISLRQLLALSPQQGSRLLDQASQFSQAGISLDREITQGGRPETLSAAHRRFQQAWTALAATLRSSPSLQANRSCEQMDSYVADLGALVSGGGRFQIPGGR